MRTQGGETRFDGMVTPCGRVTNVEFVALEFALRIAIDVADFFHFEKINYRLVDLKP